MRLSRITLSAFVTGFSGAAMPGPVLVAAIWFATGPWGAWAGPAIMLGHFVLEVSVVVALALGLARRLRQPDSGLARAIGLVGGAMLLWMAGDMLRGLPQLSLAGVQARQQHFGPLAAGLVLSAINPYFWLWWATIGLGLFGEAVSQRGRAGLVAFYSGHISSDLAWYSLVTLLVATGRGLLTDNVYRGLIGACACGLVWFGLRFVVLALRGAPAMEASA